VTAHGEHDPVVPKAALYGAAFLMVSSIAIAGLARQHHVQAAARAPAAPPGITAELRFEDQDDGAVVVRRADSNDVVATIAPGEGGFVRGSMRGMNRTRMLSGIDRGLPFTLTQERDGRLMLRDPHTGREMELRSFGRDNHEAFARILARATGGSLAGGAS
jgi:putative photosynthetic complex assembly protein